jgi:hypothetical protein
MSLVCRQCSRNQPEQAQFCWFDGAPLGGSKGPLNPGQVPFPAPFAFDTSISCNNFDQLALACQSNWKKATEHLKQGAFLPFFRNMGRADLAFAAKEAANFPDLERGLDQLLDKLPTQAMQGPQLRVQPTELNLGLMQVGVDRTMDLHLENLGMRLVYGTVSSNVPWMVVGDGRAERIVQFNSETHVPVTIRGANLRAGLKPLEGRVTIDTNAGQVFVNVRLEVPCTPFTEPGVLQGSLTPRQVAEKAKANPKAAMPFFESGSVKKWFGKNGWTYPVQGPSMPGLAGIQQFFEALGLAKPPKVRCNTSSIQLRGDPGTTVTHEIQVTTDESRPVYAYATSDQDWIDGSECKPAGRTATILLKAKVPNRPGETLTSYVVVHGNGNQRFPMPLTLAISRKAPPPMPEFAPARAPMPEATFTAVEPIFTPTLASSAPPPLPSAITAAAPSPLPLTPTLVDEAEPGDRKSGGMPSWLLDCIVGGTLAFALLMVLMVDLLTKPREMAAGPNTLEVKIVRDDTRSKATAKLKIALVPTHVETIQKTGERVAWDDMGLLLREMGEGFQYTELRPEQIATNPQILDGYQVVFLTCAPGGEELSDALKRYVAQGGTLYASDWRFDAVARAFPDRVNFQAQGSGTKQKLQADVVDPGLREVMGNHILLNFDLPRWKTAAFGGPGTSVLVQGNYRRQRNPQDPIGEPATAPLLVKFGFGKGTVIFTSFHYEKANSEVEKKLLQYLIFRLVTADVENAVNAAISEGGFSPAKSNLLSTPKENPSVTKTFKLERPGSLVFALGFRNEGAKLAMHIRSPQGKDYTWEGESTVVLEVPNASAGEWTYTVTAKQLPYENFPFNVTVGEKR